MQVVLKSSENRRAVRRFVAIAAWIVPWTLLALPVTGGANNPPPSGTEPAESEYAVPTTLDRAGRVVADVHVGSNGPFRFIIDTGANRSAISELTAQRLGAVAAEQTMVHGITGSAVMPQVKVDEFRVGELRFPEQRLAILPDAVFGGLDGILGIDALQDARVDIDFVNDRVVVRRSGRSNPGGRTVIRATVRHKGLLMIPARVGRISVQAIIDTGAERSLGNAALLAALQNRYSYTTVVSTVVGATAQVATGLALRAPPIDLGGARVGNLLITFADFHVFKVWSLLDEPALVLGMDVLGTLPEFAIDYPRREFQPLVNRRLPPIYSQIDSTP